MTLSGLRLRAMNDGGALMTSDAGRFFVGTAAFVDRLYRDELTSDDRLALRHAGHVVEPDDSLGKMSHLRGLAERRSSSAELDYLILVPTLRCNLSCTYCQVSRVAENKLGFDWSAETLAAVLDLIDGLRASRVKIEFQGGEPTLRPDIIRAVIERCARFELAEFVICTNLQRVDDQILELFDRPNVFISTSLDGAAATHTANRTGDAQSTDTFAANLQFIIDRYGPRKVSALPTVNPEAPPDIDSLIDAYASRGLDSIFLRPINFQGFARKRHSGSRELDGAWRDYHERFVRRIIARNWKDRSRVLEETYLSIALRRIFRPGSERHVDLRNPNLTGGDYIVIDHSGTVYPTDEARMLARSGVVDLALGDVVNGWDGDTRALLNANASNDLDPDCLRCTYQPFCGRDVIDDLARYGRIDLPRHETAFCQRHLHLFDLAFELIYSQDEAVKFSLSRWLRLPGTPAVFGEVLS